jgi:hypothetical protein
LSYEKEAKSLLLLVLFRLECAAGPWRMQADCLCPGLNLGKELSYLP